ncbi:MAG: peptidylprolyl isomerase, partial [Blastocatellia bacterium]
GALRHSGRRSRVTSEISLPRAEPFGTAGGVAAGEFAARGPRAEPFGRNFCTAPRATLRHQALAAAAGGAAGKPDEVASLLIHRLHVYGSPALNKAQPKFYSIVMRTRLVVAALAILNTSLFAQLPPTTTPTGKPLLKRDRTQRILYPKIIQHEDERAVTNDLIELTLPLHGGARRRTILALGRIGYPSGLAPLMDILNGDKNAENRDPEMRALAAFALGQIQNQHAVSALLERLDPAIETSALVRGRSAEALGKIASNNQASAALGKYGIGGIAVAILRLLPSPETPISDDSKFVASMALTALLRIRQPSTVEAISLQLRSPDSDLRWQAANALARIREGVSVAVPGLLLLLDDKEPLVRANAARALGVAKATQAVDPLIRLLGDKDERVTAGAIGALGAIGDGRAVDPLVALGSSLLASYRSFDRDKLGVPPQQNLLLLIATALGNIKDDRALPFLKSLRFADGKVGAHPEVEIAVAKFGEAAFFDVAASVKLLGDDWKAMSAYAQGLGQLANDRAKTLLLDLISGNSHGKPDARAVPAILNALAAAKADGLRDILFEQLKAPDVFVRETAASLLGDLGDSSDAVVTALYQAYKSARTDKTNDARIAIVVAADKLKHPMNIQVLAEQTRDDDYVVRLKAAELLRASPTEVIGARALSIGRVDTGHDRAYWRRIADLSESLKKPSAVIHTKKGEIRLELFAADAPMTVDNFMSLARRGFYNGLAFVRVVPNFVIQGGDPRGDQNGGPGYQIRDEINLRRYETGTVGMALSGKDTGGSQFFITHSPQPHLDGGYTIFGRVAEGMDVVNRIARGDRIERIEIIEPK